MHRRALLRTAGVLLAAGGVMGHSPYRQWQAYRKSRLIIVTSAADPASYPLGEAIATLLGRHVPETRALAARTGDALEIVKLLGSRQLDLALLTAEDARAAYEGGGRFASEGAVPLRALAVLGSYLLVCRDDFPAAQAQVLTRTLAEHWRDDGALPPATSVAAASIPAHAAVSADRAGEKP
jgi:hypothetical protein